MAEESSIRVSISDGTQVSGEDAATLETINSALRDFETSVQRLDLRDCPQSVKPLLAKSELEAHESRILMDHLLLSREELLKVINASGRQPNVEGGGQLKVFDETHDYYYPNLWAVQPGTDYGRFDRMHINSDDKGVGVDEVIQLLFGGPMIVRHRSTDGREMQLTLSCADASSGWLLSYNGGAPHVGSFRSATIGTKALVQVIGPPSFKMRYVE